MAKQPSLTLPLIEQLEFDTGQFQPIMTPSAQQKVLDEDRGGLEAVQLHVIQHKIMLYNNFEYWDIFILLLHRRIQKIA